jgi:hypothetical protein
MIESLRIQNVRGIKDRTFTFDQPQMHPNKVHLLIAPNGFGKSSIATAFANLKPRSLKLDEKDIYLHDHNRKPELTITDSENGTKKYYTANENKNELSKDFYIQVIRSSNRIKSYQRPVGGGHKVAIAELIIDDIELCKIPENCSITYSYKDTSTSFGENGNALPNINGSLGNLDILSPFIESDIARRSCLIIPQRKIQETVDAINDLEGTSKELHTQISDGLINQLESIEELKLTSELFTNISSKSERYLAAIQLINIHKQNNQTIKDTCVWLTYKRNRKRAKELLTSCNPNGDWIQLQVRKSSDKLVIKLPKPTTMSNGQRDLLCFLAQLLRFEFSSQKNKSILIIDEVFDYLDYANLLSCQYFLSRLITLHKERGQELFPIVLTHLDPSVFNSFVFSKKLQKNHFLDKSTEVNRNGGLYKIIQTRNDTTFETVFAQHFAHHSLQDCDERSRFKALGLKETWGCSKAFKEYCTEEAKKYLYTNATKIDYLAVCLHLRVRIEQHACEQLTPQTLQSEFTNNTKMTIPKLDFAIENGAEVPEVHYLLASLYNSALHPTNGSGDFASPVVSKMRNNSIKEMIRDALNIR